jgi:hypothetical protein
MRRRLLCGRVTVLVLLACLVQAPFLAHLRTLTDRPPDYRTYLACSTSREVLQLRVDEKGRLFNLPSLLKTRAVAQFPAPEGTNEASLEPPICLTISGIWVFFPGRSPPVSC